MNRTWAAMPRESRQCLLGEPLPIVRGAEAFVETAGNPNFHMPNRLPNSDRIKDLTSAYKIHEGDDQITGCGVCRVFHITYFKATCRAFAKGC